MKYIYITDDDRFGKFFFGKHAIWQIEFSKSGFKNLKINK